MPVTMRVPFEFDRNIFSETEEINSSFASGSLKIMYLGNNRNGSHFSKEAVEKALPSLFNVPIVANYNRENNEIGGHDKAVVRDSERKLKIVNLTEPCGVVPEHATFSFVTEEDEDGVEHEYLVAENVILWKRQEVYDHIVNDLDGQVKHSMEITVKESEYTEDGYFDFTDFEFTALCLLETSKPCFEGSQLTMYSVNQAFKLKMDEMMQELKEAFSENHTSSLDVDDKQKGGEGLEKEKEFDEIAEEESKENEEAIEETNSEADTENEDEAVDEVEGEAEEKDEAEKEESDEAADNGNFELNRNVLESLTEEIAMYGRDRHRYLSMVDYDAEKKEVYLSDWDKFGMYGYSYEVSGDKAAINWDSETRKKYAIVDYDGAGIEELPVPSEFAGLKEKYSELEAKFEEAKAELEELRKFKADIEDAADKEAKDSLFEQFTDLAKDEAYVDLKENASNFTLEELEEKLYAIRGKKVSTKEFSEKKKPVVLRINKEEKSKRPYGGLFDKYGKKK